MKKTNFGPSGLDLSVAMSHETGCLVMVRDGNRIVGSLTREQSVAFAESIIHFVPPIMAEPAKPRLTLVKDGHAESDSAQA
jgi:hypothetical protein